MADVIGPTSRLPGAAWDMPDGTMCDEHPERPAVARIQGETDSFGAELNDMCQECLNQYRKEMAEADHSGTCDWCHQPKSHLRPQRDYEEGMAGRVYEVCDDCIKRVNDEAEADLEARGYYDDYDDGPDLDDDGWDECGMMADGQCSQAGTEWCDWDCPRNKGGG
jgi:hypothetical protein